MQPQRLLNLMSRWKCPHLDKEQLKEMEGGWSAINQGEGALEKHSVTPRELADSLMMAGVT